MEASDIQEHLIVETSRTVIGALHDGATVRKGAQLTVNGAVVGPIHVESDSIFMVQGSFNGSIEANEGTLILCGQVDLDLDAIFGNVAVAIDSLVTTPHGHFRLLPNGDLEALTESRYPAGSFNVRADQVCYFDPKTRRFQPLRARI